jgi:molybdate transport system ATP-binding protein
MELTLKLRLAEHDAPPLDADILLSSDALGVSGPSGIGKTTLLRVLAGVESRARGKIVVDEAVWLDSDAGVFVPPEARGTGWVPQDFLLFPDRSVRENLFFGHRGTGGGPQPDEVIGPLDLAALLSREPRSLSAGERQRVAIGRALLARPKVLLLDEPFSALDRPARTRVAAALRKLRHRYRFSLLLFSRNPEDARELAEVSLTLADGRLVMARYEADVG